MHDDGQLTSAQASTRSEVAAGGHESTVDALLHLTVPKGFTRVVPPGVCTDRRHGAPRRGAARREPEVTQEVESERGRGPRLPFGLPQLCGESGWHEGAAGPLAVFVLARQGRGSPALVLHAGPLRFPDHVRLPQEVAPGLPLDGRVSVQ